MRRTSLWWCLGRAVRCWRSFGQERAQFRHWLRTGKIDLRASALAVSARDGLMACMVRDAVLAGAQEAVFSRRRLRGIRQMEIREGFLSLDHGSVVNDWCASERKPLAQEDITYWTRFEEFERIDTYYLFPEAGPVLRGGCGLSVGEDLEVMREVLSQAWRLEVIREDAERGAGVRGTGVSIKACEHRPGVEFGFEMEYLA